jgi:hypothetical protein
MDAGRKRTLQVDFSQEKFACTPARTLLKDENCTVRVPHPFPRFLRKWVGNDVTVLLPDQ